MKYVIAAIVCIVTGVGVHALYAEDDGIFGETQEDNPGGGAPEYVDYVDIWLYCYEVGDTAWGNTGDHPTKHHYWARSIDQEPESNWEISIGRGCHYDVWGTKTESEGEWRSPKYEYIYYGTSPDPHEVQIYLTWYPSE